MAVRVSGNAVLELSWDPERRLRPGADKGAFVVLVYCCGNLVDRMFVDPETHRITPSLIDEIARTVLESSLSVAPTLEPERDGQGRIRVHESLALASGGS